MNKRRRYKAKRRRRDRNSVRDVLNGLQVRGVNGVRAPTNPADWRYALPPNTWRGVDWASGSDWTVER